MKLQLINLDVGETNTQVLYYFGCKVSEVTTSKQSKLTCTCAVCCCGDVGAVREGKNEGMARPGAVVLGGDEGGNVI